MKQQRYFLLPIIEAVVLVYKTNQAVCYLLADGWVD